MTIHSDRLEAGKTLRSMAEGLKSQGKTNTQIAAEMGLTEGVVNRIFDKPTVILIRRKNTDHVSEVIGSFSNFEAAFGFQMNHKEFFQNCAQVTVIELVTVTSARELILAESTTKEMKNG